VPPHVSRIQDQLNFLAGDLADQVAVLLGDRADRFCVAPRARRHLWLALVEIAPSAAMSGLLRFGFDARPRDLIGWVIDYPSPWLWSLLRRCMPAEPLPAGSYLKLYAALDERPRTGQVLSQLGRQSIQGWATIFTLPPCLIEASIVRLIGSTPRRAEALGELWRLALDLGRDPSNLRRALCSAKDTEAMEAVLAKAVQADQLILAPQPNRPEVKPISTAKELSGYGFALQNCMARRRGPFSLRPEATAFFIWNDEDEGPVMVSARTDHVGWRLVEVRRTRNGRPSDHLFRRIVDAFEGVGVRNRPDISDLLMAI